MNEMASPGFPCDGCENGRCNTSVISHNNKTLYLTRDSLHKLIEDASFEAILNYCNGSSDGSVIKYADPSLLQALVPALHAEHRHVTDEFATEIDLVLAKTDHEAVQTHEMLRKEREALPAQNQKWMELYTVPIKLPRHELNSAPRDIKHVCCESSHASDVNHLSEMSRLVVPFEWRGVRYQTIEAARVAAHLTDARDKDYFSTTGMLGRVDGDNDDYTCVMPGSGTRIAIRLPAVHADMRAGQLARIAASQLTRSMRRMPEETEREFWNAAIRHKYKHPDHRESGVALMCTMDMILLHPPVEPEHNSKWHARATSGSKFGMIGGNEVGEIMMQTRHELNNDQDMDD